MLLGLLLTRGDVFEATADTVKASHFYEPVHRRAFETIATQRARGLAITRDRLGTLLAIDPAFREAGGESYMDRVIQDATLAEIQGVDPGELARTVVDLHLRREVIAACADIQADARGSGLTSGAELRERLEARLFQADYQDGRAELSSFDAMTVHAVEQAKAGGTELLSTGLAKIDERIGRCERGDLVLIGARPSMGKSALASRIALCAAMAGLGAIELNGEMSDAQVARRHLSDHAFTIAGNAAPTSRDMRNGTLTDQHHRILADAQRELLGIPLKALKRPGITLQEIRRLARRQAMEWKAEGISLGFLLVDHVGIVASGQDVRDLRMETTLISKGLKILADELECVVVALSQLSRALEQREDKRPTLPDLRESGSLEQDADVVLGLYRDAYYAQRETEPKDREKRVEWLRRKALREMECIALKVREGAPGTETLWADVAHNAVRDERPAPLDGTDLNPAPAGPLFSAPPPTPADEVILP